MGHRHRPVCVHGQLQQWRVSSTLLWPPAGRLSLWHFGMKAGTIVMLGTCPDVEAQVFCTLSSAGCLWTFRDVTEDKQSKKQEGGRGSGFQYYASWKLTFKKRKKKLNTGNKHDSFKIKKNTGAGSLGHWSALMYSWYWISNVQYLAAHCIVVTAPPVGKYYHHAIYCITVPFINVITYCTLYK